MEKPPRCGSVFLGKNRRKFAFLQQIWKSPACSSSRCFQFTHSIGKSPSASASSPQLLLPLLALAILTHTRTRNSQRGRAREKEPKKTETRKANVSVYGDSVRLPAYFPLEQKTYNFGSIPRLFRLSLPAVNLGKSNQREIVPRTRSIFCMRTKKYSSEIGANQADENVLQDGYGFSSSLPCSMVSQL